MQFSCCLAMRWWSGPAERCTRREILSAYALALCVLTFVPCGAVRVVPLMCIAHDTRDTRKYLNEKFRPDTWKYLVNLTPLLFILTAFCTVRNVCKFLRDAFLILILRLQSGKEIVKEPLFAGWTNAVGRISFSTFFILFYVGCIQKCSRVIFESTLLILFETF